MYVIVKVSRPKANFARLLHPADSIIAIPEISTCMYLLPTLTSEGEISSPQRISVLGMTDSLQENKSLKKLPCYHAKFQNL